MTSDDDTSGLALQLAQDFPKPPDLDPDLARVVEAWPALSDPIRAAILALVAIARR